LPRVSSALTEIKAVSGIPRWSYSHTPSTGSPRASVTGYSVDQQTSRQALLISIVSIRSSVSPERRYPSAAAGS
jgi:hypothetical protein